MQTKLYEEKLNEIETDMLGRVGTGTQRSIVGILVALFFTIYILYRMETGYKYLDSALRYAEIDEKISKKLREIIGDDSIQIYKVNSSQVNAFTYKGPSFYYYTGLVNKLKLTDEELCAILIHEYGHYKELHTAFTGHAKFSATFFIIFSVLLVISLQTPMLYNVVLSILSIIFGGAFTSRLQRYTEVDADGYIIKYGYKKEGISAFRKLYEYERKMVCDEMDIPRGESCDSYIKSRHTFDEHPPTVDRIERLVNSLGLAKLFKAGNFTALGKIYKKVKELLKRKKG